MKPGDISLDGRRQQRLGFDEAIYCEGKTVAHLGEILRRAEANADSLLLTRLSEEKLFSLPPGLRDRIDYEAISQTGIFGEHAAASTAARVAVLCAGTSDVRVAREAVRTLHYYGHAAQEVFDVGVAGIWRLTERLDEITDLPIAIVIAGMDAALPSVVGGLFRGQIIAVPTSVGYGVAEGGHTALRAILASCAPGVTVMNIDNGYGAACAAIRTLNVATLLMPRDQE